MKSKKHTNLIIFNKYIIGLIVVFAILVTGSTYSYLAYRYENTSVIKGNVVSVNATLDVELVGGNNSGLVPLKDDALTNAINGKGGESVCVDANGNLSCQVYKITLTNKGSKLDNLKGTIKLYAKNSSSKYTNLKWRELSDTKTVKDGSIINGMNKSTLVSGLSLSTGEVATYYIAVYVQEVDTDQTNTDKGSFEGMVTFSVDDSTPALTLISKDAVSDSSIDFSQISSDTNGKGVYILNSTVNDTNPIYYYRGAVDNNNVLFAGYCWKIVRTTETGGTKLIYNGSPTNGTCNNTGSNSQIGTKAFNSSYNSPAYVGYMYGTVYSYSSKSLSSDTTAYVYGNDVTYANGTYTLTDTISNGSWSSIYNTSDGIYNHHYTCFTTGTTCSNVYYVYYTSSLTAYYITLKSGKKVEDALSEMLDNNTTSSTIKGNKTTSGTLDYWYYTNIESKGYSDYVEDTVWCNDRSIYSKGGWNPDGGKTTGSWTNYSLLFGAQGRLNLSKTPSLTCTRDIDKFTVNTSNGNGDLDYPIGLITADEVALAGGVYNTSNNTYYLNTGNYWWAGSASYFSNAYATGFYVGSGGNLLNNFRVNNANGVRPSLSLVLGTTISSGDGTVNNPYVINTDES